MLSTNQLAGVKYAYANIWSSNSEIPLLGIVSHSSVKTEIQSGMVPAWAGGAHRAHLPHIPLSLAFPGGVWLSHLEQILLVIM